MANGLVTYRGHDLDRGDVIPSANHFEFFEDFFQQINEFPVAGAADSLAELQYPGVLISTAGTPATMTPAIAAAEVGGAIAFDTASDAIQGISVPRCVIDPDGGDWFLETRVKVTTVEGTGGFRFGLQEDVSVTDTMSQDVGAASEDQISMFYNAGSDTAGLLETLICKNTAQTVSGSAGVAGAQMESDVFARLGMEYNSATNRIYFYFNGKEVAAEAVTNVSDQLLHPFIAASHDAMGDIVVDYIYARGSR
jgi:hypothetical protein